jgi:hypothetical protein
MEEVSKMKNMEISAVLSKAAATSFSVTTLTSSLMLYFLHSIISVYTSVSPLKQAIRD